MIGKKDIESLIGKKTVDVTYEGEYNNVTKENLKLSEVSNGDYNINPEYYSKIILKGNDKYKITLFPEEITEITESGNKKLIYRRPQGGKQKTKNKKQKTKNKKQKTKNQEKQKDVVNRNKKYHL